MSDCLWPHELQHVRFPCPSLFYGVCSNSCPLIWWCYPTTSSSVNSFSSCLQYFPASIFQRVFSKESAFHIKCPKYWSFSFSIILSKKYSGLIFRIDWFNLLAIQGTLKSLLQHYSSKALVFQHSAFFMVQLSHPYKTTRKIIASTIRTFISKVVSLLFKTLARFVIAFLPRRKCLISWLQSPSAVILEPKKMKSISVSTFFPYICHEVLGPDGMILSTCLFNLYAD